MAPYVVTKANTRRQIGSFENNSEDNVFNTMMNLKGGFTFDLNGFDQSIDQIAMHADADEAGGHVTSAAPATLHVQTEAAYWAGHNYSQNFGNGYKSISQADSYGYETADKGYWEGAVTLSYEAKGTMRRSMMRTSSTTGRIEVVSGTLVFLRRAAETGETFDLKGGSANPYPRLAKEDGAWPDATEARVTGGTLVFEHGGAIGKGTDVRLSTAAGKLRLEAGVRQPCRFLYIDGVRQPCGKTYGAAESDAARKAACFAGPGVLFPRGDGSGMCIILR